MRSCGIHKIVQVQNNIPKLVSSEKSRSPQEFYIDYWNAEIRENKPKCA